MYLYRSDLVSIEPRYTYPAKITIKHPLVT